MKIFGVTSFETAGCVLTGQYREVETRMSGADSALLSLSYEEVAALSGEAPMAARSGVARGGGGSRVSPRLAQPLTAHLPGQGLQEAVSSSAWSVPGPRAPSRTAPRRNQRRFAYRALVTSFETAGCVLTGQCREVETRMSGVDSALLSLSYEEVAALSGGAPMAASFSEGSLTLGGDVKASAAPNGRAKAFKKQ